MKNKMPKLFVGLCAALISACASHPSAIKPLAHVDLNQFMGDWYVIACIPTMIETEAYNAIESYQLETDGSIKTTFVFRNGGFDGPKKQYNPRGFVVDNTGNAIWGMQFIWPIKAEYIIAYLDKDYSSTIVARNARDYVWIMARTPFISDSRYQELTKTVADLGYDVSKLRKIPHQPN
ncbi:MAG: lipocalin family protein [Methylococcales bacterium]|nr:lipocalin family protein [Methylococcales bacterium]